MSTAKTCCRCAIRVVVGAAMLRAGASVSASGIGIFTLGGNAGILNTRVLLCAGGADVGRNTVPFSGKPSVGARAGFGSTVLLLIIVREYVRPRAGWSVGMSMSSFDAFLLTGAAESANRE